MKIKNLKENEALMMDNVSLHVDVPGIIGKDERKLSKIELDRVKMILFTDAKNVREDEVVTESIKQYVINEKNYDHDVDTLKTTQLYLDDYSYAIRYLITSEWTRYGNIGGWFDVIRDITIYLKDINDKKTLQEAKRMIKMIDEYSNKVNFSSFRKYLSTSIVLDNDFERVKENIYTLKR